MQTFLIVAGIVIFLVVTFRILGIGVREQVVTDPAERASADRKRKLNEQVVGSVASTLPGCTVNFLNNMLPEDVGADLVLAVYSPQGVLCAVGDLKHRDDVVDIMLLSPFGKDSVEITVAPDNFAFDEDTKARLRDLVKDDPNHPWEQRFLERYLDNFQNWEFELSRTPELLIILAVQAGISVQIALHSTQNPGKADLTINKHIIHDVFEPEVPSLRLILVDEARLALAYVLR
jgi:hypothetical protein